MELVSDEKFEMPRRTLAILMAFSACWVCIDTVPLFPIGLLATVRFVGNNYEVTFLKSLVTGWRVIATSAAIALVGLAFGPVLNIGSDGRAGVFGFWLLFGIP